MIFNCVIQNKPDYTLAIIRRGFNRNYDCISLHCMCEAYKTRNASLMYKL